MDIVLLTTENHGEIYLNFLYSTKLFKKEKAVSILNSYKKVAAGIIGNNRVKIKNIGLLEEKIKQNLHSVLQEDMADIAFELDI